MFKRTDKGIAVTADSSGMQYHWAATHQHAMTRAKILLGAGVFVSAIGIGIWLSAFLGVDYGRYRLVVMVFDTALAGVGSLLLAGAFFSYIEAQYNWSQLMGSVVREELSKSVEDLGGVDDLMGLMLANRKQIDAYDALARSQGASSHRASLAAMGIGLVMVCAGLVVAVMANESSTKYSAAIIAATGTVTGGFITQTFIKVQKAAQDQMRYYFQQPLVHSYLLTAERLAVQLPEDLRSEQYRLLVDGALDQARKVSGQCPGEMGSAMLEHDAAEDMPA